MRTNVTIDRRRFIELTGLGATALAVGCGAEPSPGGSGGARASAGGFAGTGGAGGFAGSAGVGGASGAGGVSGGLPQTCGEVTASNIEGPFFSPDSPRRNDIRAANWQGTLVVVSGRVWTTDCEPVPGAVLDFWQANHLGAYDNEGYDFRGHQLTDSSGRYELITIVPGHYLNGSTYRPAHIHAKVTAPGLNLLTTQLYFADDPFNASDPWIVDSLTMSLTEDAEGDQRAAFDFVL